MKASCVVDASVTTLKKKTNATPKTDANAYAPRPDVSGDDKRRPRLRRIGSDEISAIGSTRALVKRAVTPVSRHVVAMSTHAGPVLPSNSRGQGGQSM